MSVSTVIAVVVGILQGVLEWLPVSSEGSVALVLTVLSSADPGTAVRLSLFLHAGTGLAAGVYYRSDFRSYLTSVSTLTDTRSREGVELRFLGIATAVSGLVGGGLYVAVKQAFSNAATVPFVVLIGLLLVVTGVLQRAASGRYVEERTQPGWLDAVLVGAGQGLALLPGVSRSGTTTSILLLRGYPGELSFRLSFLLAVPASLAAGGLAVLDGGVPAVAPGPAVLALAASALVGYATIGGLLAFVRRVEFWAVCVGFGALTLAGAVLLA